MIVKTEALVLRSRKYRETSSILTLYTREFGKLSVVGKGARGPRNKFGSSLQPLSHVSAVLYKHERSDLHLLSQCDTLGRLERLAGDLDKFGAAMSVAELLEHVAHDEQRNDEMFDLTLDVFRAIDETPTGTNAITFFFMLRLSDLLGFRADFHSCLSCSRPLDEKSLGTKGGELRLLSGGAVCPQCTRTSGGERKVSAAAVKILQRIQDAKAPGELTRLRMTRHQTEEVEGILRQYLQQHVDGLHRLKAASVRRRILDSSSPGTR